MITLMIIMQFFLGRVCMKDFEVLAHTADIKIRAYGTTLNELFRNALVGMFQVIGPISPNCTRVNDRTECIALPIKHTIDLRAPQLDILLVDFLSEALYLSDVNNEAYLDAKILEVDEYHVRGVIYGIAVEGFEVVEIKAVTYHDLEIIHSKDGYRVDIVFDI